MSSRSVVLLGQQEPRVLHSPEGAASSVAADEAIELAEAYGPPLDEAQKIVLRAGLGTTAGGLWAAALVAHMVSRQNGKGDEIQARELAGLVLWDEGIIHTSHEMPTTVNAFNRLVSVFKNFDDLGKRVQRIRYANGEQAIEMKSGAFIRYRARTGGGGRGLDDISLVVYDEAQHLQPEHVAASSPTLATNVNAQVWMAGSAGLSTSAVWHGVRLDALRRVGGRFAYVEHSAEEVSLDADGVPRSVKPDPEDQVSWAGANPAFGRRITAEFLQAQLRLMGPALFLREHLGVWDPLPDVSGRGSVVPPGLWAAGEDLKSRTHGPIVVGVDVAPESAWASVGVAGRTLAGREHVEVVDAAPGAAWVLDRVGAMLGRHEVDAVAVEAGGPVGVLLPDLRRLCEARRVDLVELPGRAYAAACQGFVDGVSESRLAHLGQAWLSTAVGGARQRKFADLWVWDRWGQVDVTPLVSVTVALRVMLERKPSERRSAYEDEPLMVV